MLSSRRAITHTWHCWQQTLNSPTAALPVDLFRVLVGLVSFVYVVQLMVDLPDISSPDGLIDHALVYEVFWYARLSLLQPGMQDWQLYLTFLVAALAAGMVVIGWRPKLAAAVLYLVVVSAYRWNFIVAFLDDGLTHLAVGWLILMPVGRTLVLRDWLRKGRPVWQRWKCLTIPGVTVRLFLANLALIYLTAGLWKWTSPMWLDGSALYAGLKMPVSLAPDLWQPEHLPVLRLLNYAALFLEPLLALLAILPKSHPLKCFLVAGAIGFHGGMIVTMRIPYASLLCLISLVLVLRNEMMEWLHSPVANRARRRVAQRKDVTGKLALALVSLLTLTMIGDALPWWIEPGNLSRQPSPDGLTLAPGQVAANWRADHNANNPWQAVATEGNPLYGPLWLAGFAQKYRLFDWIDDVNYVGQYDILDGQTLITGSPAAQRLFPVSTRGAALQGYVNDVRWVIIPPGWSNSVKQSLFERIARRYCRIYRPNDVVEVFVTVERITLQNLRLDQGRRERLVAFQCTEAEPNMIYMRLAKP